MDLALPIEGATCRVDEGALIVRFREPVKSLASAVLNGGLRRTRALVNITVDRGFSDPNPRGFLRRRLKGLGLPTDTVGLMTAVDVRNVAVASRVYEKLKVSALVTAGLSWPAAVGDKEIYKPPLSGTINTIILIDGNLTDGCLVNLVSAVAEAKVLALRRLDVRSRFSGLPATGTTSDAVAVACTGRGEEVPHGGSATRLGEMVGEAVGRALEEAIEKEEKLTRGRPLIKRLEERGVSLDNLVEVGLELFTHPIKFGGRQVAATLLRESLSRNLSDVNVASLILAALRLEEDGKLGLIPGLSGEEFLSDPVSLVADERIGVAISDYIAGVEGVQTFLSCGGKECGLQGQRLSLGAALRGLIAGSLSQICKPQTDW